MPRKKKEKETDNNLQPVPADQGKILVFSARVQGVSALLQNRFTESAQAPGATRPAMVVDRDPRTEAQNAVYQDDEGRYYMPGTYFGRMMREAGGSHKIKGTRKSVKYVVPAAVIVLDDAIPILEADFQTPVDSFEVDSRPVTIPATKGKIMRHRPRFNSWHAQFEVQVDTAVLPSDLIGQLLQEGGRRIGVGDFRPERGGPFGRFLVVSWQLLREEDSVFGMGLNSIAAE